MVDKQEIATVTRMKKVEEMTDFEFSCFVRHRVKLLRHEIEEVMNEGSDVHVKKTPNIPVFQKAQAGYCQCKMCGCILRETYFNQMKHGGKCTKRKAHKKNKSLQSENKKFQ
jgi:hypothetical protein